MSRAVTYRLRDFGSYTAGGRVLRVTEGAPQRVNFTRSTSYEIDPRGHYAIEHAYVQYFVPETRRPGPPVLLVHGGGMSGSCWETTPDGRPGWLHLLLTKGYEVHVIDNVERGRAGFAPGVWDGQPVLRTLEEAWALFRIGPREGFRTRTAYPGQRFPVDHFDSFARTFVPRWLTTSPLQVAALVAVLERTGPALVICHSQGAELAFDAHRKAPHLFRGIIALEPSGLPNAGQDLTDIPVVLCTGDHLDNEPLWIDRKEAWVRFIAQRASDGGAASLLTSDDLGAGNSHMLMMDANCGPVLDRSLHAFQDLRGSMDRRAGA